jgi:hypothetical protein
VYMYMCPIQNVSEMEIFHCTVPKLLIRKGYYVLFLIPVFIVQVTKLVLFTWYNTFSCEDMALCSSVQCTVQ